MGAKKQTTKAQRDRQLKAAKSVAKKPKREPKSSKGMGQVFSRLPKKTILGLFLAMVPLIGGLVWLFWDIPAPGNLTESQAVSTKIFDRNGVLIYEIFSDVRRTPVKLADIPDHVKNATIAIEDKDFYKHPGFSVSGISRALYKNIFEQKLEGGSTLTQQLVKNNLLSPERTVRRKAQEFVLSIIVEARYSKDEILEMYLNEIPYGGTSYGIEAASALYFNKSSSELSLAEAAFLAGLPAAPSRYSPFGSRPELARSRQETVLRRMVSEGYISQDEADSALNEELVLIRPQAFNAPHFALWIKEQLAERYGEAVVERGGLRAITTLDLDLQEFAQEAVRDEVEKLSGQNVGNGAALVVRPQTGEILAMVGSKDYFAEDEDGKVNIAFSLRQPGSSIKPLNYALAIESKKITASTVLADVPTCFSVAGQAAYCPRNYDGAFRGATQARFALGNSYNIPAVRVLALNGIEEFMEFSRNMGISTFNDPSRYGLSLTLGGGEVRPFDMAVAFSTLANQGVRKPLVSFLEISDWNGKLLYKSPSPDEVEGVRVLSPETAFIVSHILYDNNARLAAFGSRSFLSVAGHPEVSVKTGTTNDLRDNWTIGYSELALVLTWVGNNDNSPMRGAVSGVSGASPIWNRVMKQVLDKAKEGAYDERDMGRGWPRQPAGVVGASICANTGSLPNEHTGDCPLRFEYFLEGTVPTNGAVRQDILVFNDTGAPANEEALPEQVRTENHLVLFDPLGTLLCLDCEGPLLQANVRYTPN